MVRLTQAEKLLISRRRLKENQVTAAARYGVSFDTYSLWERGMSMKGIPEIGKIPSVTSLEELFILRRRSKITRKKLAKDLGVSLTWLNFMERGLVNNTRLIKYWEERK